MDKKWVTVLVVAVPIATTLVLFGGRLLIETEAQNYEAELSRCVETRDDSERCRTLLCLARAGNDDARAECVRTRGANDPSSSGPASQPTGD